VLLDGCGRTAGTDEPANVPTVQRPGLARVSLEPQTASAHGQNDQGSPLQKCGGVPLADLHHDLDPKGSRSKIASAERARRVGKSTHRFSKFGDGGSRWLETWNVIVEAHSEKTKAVYGLPPLPPDLKRAQQQALAECLDGAAADVAARLRDRTSVERNVRDVQRELVTRVMQLYFKRDNEHLRRVKHALRDLPREFHARITEAMQLMLRESHDLQKPRQPLPEMKFVETSKPIERPGAVPSEAVQMNTAHEARRLLEVLGGAVASDKSAMERVTDPVQQDKPIPGTRAGARPGAPRWGAVGPRPTNGHIVANSAGKYHNELGDERVKAVRESSLAEPHEAKASV